LTRRANHRQIIIIAKIKQGPGGEIRRGLFLLEIFESGGGRVSRRLISQRPSPEAWWARRRPNL
jgi:hypothetical protein